MPFDGKRENKPPGPRRPLESIDSLRPSSLPPEVDAIDMTWDDDLAPVPQQRPAPAPITPRQSEVELNEGDRPTAIPSIPMDRFVAKAMAEAESIDPSGVTGLMPTEPPLSTDDQEYRPPQLGDRQAPFTPGSAMAARPAPAGPPGGRRRTPARAPTPRAVRLPIGPALAEPPSPPTPRRAALELNRNPTPSPAADPIRARMKDCYAIGDFTGALLQAEVLLERAPGDLEAERYATSCRDVLTQMCLSRIGSLHHYIEVALPPEELRWLTLDHRAGFLLSLVDGTSTIEEILDISGMPRLEALRILVGLIDQRVVKVQVT